MKMFKDKLTQELSDIAKGIMEVKTEAVEKDKDDPCWDGYAQLGMKKDEDGNEVPNCVPINKEAKSDYEYYHKDYSTAVQHAIKAVEKRGYEVDMDDWDRKVALGPKKPSSGKTNSFSIDLMKNGKPVKQKLHMQIYNMDNKGYELNMYVQ